MNKNIANTLIVGSIIFAGAVRLQPVGSRGYQDDTALKGTFLGKWTNPKSGKEFYRIIPEGKSEKIYVTTKLIKDEMMLKATNTDSRGNYYSYSGWEPQHKIIIWIPAWFYRKLKSEGKI